ncbi:hypothetical protein [Granulicella arctica]|uniref:Uncharacterized protein n=1 Tax=Granulicella arctica TaxID=940613 RepID=A0A7Y9PFZ7_9BACT|nr:hypothetical protein [Granulicella arctica]NYF79186.1 hypothetical protein [Granulicella arctica]
MSQVASTVIQHRTRLYLKDGSYQIVMSYRIQMDRVLFISAERGGAEEEIPVALVDFDATHRWEQQHPAAGSADGAAPGPTPAPVIDPELAKEEEARRSLTPEVAPDLRLPEQDSVVAFDTFRGTPELVPLGQSAGDLNQTTSHSVVRTLVNPLSSSHQIAQLRGEASAVQLHVNQPVFYLRIGDDANASTGSTPLTVDTHGASAAMGNKPVDSAGNLYVIVRLDVRRDARIVASFHLNRLGDVHVQEDVVEATAEMLPGGHWMKLTPREPLGFGEYALMEVLSPNEVNLGVWDFGVHPTSPENRDALKPEPKKPVTLERRGPG